MKYNIFKIAFLSVTLISLVSCGGEHKEGDGHNHGKESTKTETKAAEGEPEEEHEEGIVLSKQQTETIGLEFGDLASMKETGFVGATGTLSLPPNALSSVSTKTDGILKSNKKFVEGDYIKKGEVIGYLENPEFIRLQQSYLETLAELKLKRLDVERQRILVKENAGVARNLQNAQAEVSVLSAKANGLAKQLNYLGISTKRISNGNLRQQIAIVAPMSGYISKINFNNGMYAVSSISLMEIAATDHLHLELDVFEKDFSQIAKGQKITYTIPALGQTVFEGEVNSEGKEFNNNSKTVRVHGHLTGELPKFANNLFVNAKIWLNDNTTTGLPEDAVLQDGESSFVYVGKATQGGEEFSFEKINVIAGESDNGLISVKLIDNVPEGMKIVTKGAYYVNAQSKAGELSHEH